MAGSYLDALFGRFFVNGTELELVGGINVKSPLTATVNNETGALDVSLTIEAAAQVPYDNAESELSAANVQAALDELASAVDVIGGGLDAIGIADVLANDDDADGASIKGLGFVGITAADHETAALTIASGGVGGASSAWTIGTDAATHTPPVGSHYLRVSGASSGLFVKHASSWVPYLRGPVSAARVPYMADNTGLVATSSDLVFDGANLSIAAPTAGAHAATKDYVDDAHALFEASLSGSGTADSKATIGTPAVNDGYVVASNEVTVPGPGRYLVQVMATLNNSSSSDLRPTGLSIRVAGAQLVQALGHRYGTATTGRVQVSGFKYVTITDPASQRISWHFQGTDTISIDGAPQVSNVSIERVRRG